MDCRRKALRMLPRNVSLPRCYPQSHLITDAKYKDLMALFSMKPAALSSEYFNFYSNLPHGRKEPDEDED